MPIRGDVVRAQTACKALDVACHQYQEGRLPVYKLAGECERALQDITLLLNTIIHTHGLSKNLLRRERPNTGLISDFEEIVDDVLRPSKKKPSVDPKSK